MSEKSALAIEIAALLASENAAQAERIAALEEEIRRVQAECHNELALMNEAIRKLSRRIGTLEEMP